MNMSVLFRIAQDDQKSTLAMSRPFGRATGMHDACTAQDDALDGKDAHA